SEEEGIEPEKTAERGRIIVFAEVLKRYARPVSIAASVTLILSVSLWFFNRSENIRDDKTIVKTFTPGKNIQPVIPAPKKDSVSIVVQPQNVALQPEIKKQPGVNHSQERIVKQVDKNDVMEQLYLVDENMVADYITEDPQDNSSLEEGSLDDEMLNYLLDNDADASDIKK
ncbi:MAG: hypothetical protein M3R17_05555, partial [Bacteroidota bacterium]|nr:hypothetical protein [Bacteroidota bacterium]